MGRKAIGQAGSASEPGLAPQVLTESSISSPDRRRFDRPLSMHHAVEEARFWWSAREVARVFPVEETMTQLLTWMREHDRGRKRLLDTMLAATYLRERDRATIATSNARDYRGFGVFDLVEVQ